jgi:hypothetical protein
MSFVWIGGVGGGDTAKNICVRNLEGKRGNKTFFQSLPLSIFYKSFQLSLLSDSGTKELGKALDLRWLKTFLLKF